MANHTKCLLDWTVAILTLIMTLGCRPADDIRTYTVPKEASPRGGASVPLATGEPTDRMLTAILPAGGQAWFYKVVGPIAAVDKHADAVLEFVASVPPSDGAGLPAWDLPDGWSQKPGTGGMFAALATIVIPTEGEPLELTVNRASWDESAEFLLNNVNRWRGQMGLAGIAADALADETYELKAGENTITVVDLRGQFRRGGMPPFAGGGPASRAVPGPDNRQGGLPADHPPIAGGGAHGGALPNAAAPADVPKFDAPGSWEAGPAGGMNRAVFRVAADGKEAQVTVSNVPASSGAMFSDPLAIANMWRGGVGLPEIAADQLDEVSESVEIDGRPATYVAVIPDPTQSDASPAGQATLGAMVPVGDQVWFFKMKGDREIVAGRQDAFKAFLKSVRFAAKTSQTTRDADGEEL